MYSLIHFLYKTCEFYVIDVSVDCASSLAFLLCFLFSISCCCFLSLLCFVLFSVCFFLLCCLFLSFHFSIYTVLLLSLSQCHTQVSNLFAKDELDEITQELISVMKKEFPRRPPTNDNLYDYFISRACKNLHIVLCFSPVSMAGSSHSFFIWSPYKFHIVGCSNFLLLYSVW